MTASPPRHDGVPRSAALFAALVLTVAGLAGCGGNPKAASPDLPPGFRVDLVGDSFELRVTGPSRDETAEHDFQVRPVSMVDGAARPEGAWRDILRSDGRVVIDDSTDRTYHQFRHRAAPDPDTDTSWSEPVTRLFVRTTLPVVRIDTADAESITGSKRPARQATVSLDVAGDPDASFTADAKVRGRGNTTWKHVGDKKSYQVNFDDEHAPLGLSPSDKFVLLANPFDRSQLRTFVASGLAAVTDPAWTPGFRWVEVVLNGDYRGLYQLGEKVDIGPDKVDIEVPGPDVTGGEPITGGYLLEMGTVEQPTDKRTWTTGHGVPLIIDRPEAEDGDDARFAYIRDHVAAFEMALYGNDWTDPQSGYAHYLDVDAFVDHWIVQETTVNIDAYINSTYLWKRRGDPRLVFGPIWDFDVSMGNPYGYLDAVPRGWHTIHPAIAPNVEYRPWVLRLFADPGFVQHVADRWAEVSPGFERVAASIPDAAASIETAQQADLVRWADETETLFGHRYGDTLAEDEPEFLETWLQARIDWISAELPRLAAGAPIGDRIPEREVRGPTPPPTGEPTSMGSSR